MTLKKRDADNTVISIRIPSEIGKRITVLVNKNALRVYKTQILLKAIELGLTIMEKEES